MPLSQDGCGLIHSIREVVLVASDVILGYVPEVLSAFQLAKACGGCLDIVLMTSRASLSLVRLWSGDHLA